MRLTCVAIIMLLGSRVAVAESCPAYVDQFTPEVIKSTRDFQGHPIVAKSVCTTVTVGSRQVLAVVYSDGLGARLVTIDPVGPKLIKESTKPMSGATDLLVNRDIGGGYTHPVLFVTLFSMSRDSVLYVYSIDYNGVAQLISPSDLDEVGPLTEPMVLDVDGSGALSIIDYKYSKEYDSDGLSVVTPIYTLFCLANGRFAERTDLEVLFADSFTRDTGAPKDEKRHFHAEQIGPYKMTLLNGKLGRPEEACESGVVSVDGQQAFGESDFKRKSYVSTATVQLLENNTIDVTLRGKPGCHAFILVTGAK